MSNYELDKLIGKACIIELDDILEKKKIVTTIVGYDTEDGDIIVGMPEGIEFGWKLLLEATDNIPMQYRNQYPRFRYVEYEDLDTISTDPTTILEWAKDLIGKRILVTFPWFEVNDDPVEVRIVGYNKFNNLPIIEVSEDNDILVGWCEASDDDVIDDKYVNSSSSYLYLIEGCIFKEIKSAISVSDKRKEYNIVVEKCNKEVITIKVTEEELIDKLKEIRDSYNNAKDGDFLLLEKTLVFKRQIKDINVLKI